MNLITLETYLGVLGWQHLGEYLFDQSTAAYREQRKCLLLYLRNKDFFFPQFYWNIINILHYFQVYNIMIRYMYLLTND